MTVRQIHWRQECKVYKNDTLRGMTHAPRIPCLSATDLCHDMSFSPLFADRLCEWCGHCLLLRLQQQRWPGTMRSRQREGLHSYVWYGSVATMNDSYVCVGHSCILMHEYTLCFQTVFLYFHRSIMYVIVMQLWLMCVIVQCSVAGCFAQLRRGLEEHTCAVL